MKVRISKLLSERGICSRREADRYLEEGKVYVDGRIATLGERADPTADLKLHRDAEEKQQSKITVILNKPVGFVSTQPEKGYSAAIELITKENYLFPSTYPPFLLKELHVAGRLDIDSKGLLVLTQCGTVTKQLIGPDSNLEKEYLVWVDGKITEETLERLRFGISLDEKPLKRAKVVHEKFDVLKIILTEGKKRQIRRMCKEVGLYVKSLKRVRIGKIYLDDLPEGKWRILSPQETFI